jgi:hypothetical protein
MARLGEGAARSGDDSGSLVVGVLDCFGYCADKGDLRGAVFHQAGNEFAAFEVHEHIFVDAGFVGAQGVFEESGVVAADAKDEEVARVADDSVLEFIVVDLCKELVGEGEIEERYNHCSVHKTQVARLFCRHET